MDDGKTKGKVIKSGTYDWWLWVAMLHVAKQERKKGKLPPTSPIMIDIDLCNDFIKRVNRNPLKKLWLLLSIGDLKPQDRAKLGNEVRVKGDGIVHSLFKKD